MTYCGTGGGRCAAAPRARRRRPPMRSSILSPLAERSNDATPSASFSLLRVLRSKRVSVAPPPPPPPRPPPPAAPGSMHEENAGAPGTSCRCRRAQANGRATMRCWSLSKSMRTGLGGVSGSGALPLRAAFRRGLRGRRSAAGRGCAFLVALRRQRRRQCYSAAPPGRRCW